MRITLGRVLTLGLFLAAVPAAAVPFERVYGPANTADQGARRVLPVTACAPAGGFVAVGTTQVPGSTADVYVVRTDNAGNTGAPYWERSYDLTGLQLEDEGRALVELPDGSGFVLLGNTLDAAAWSTVLMKIDCTGAPVWTRQYRAAVQGPTFKNLRGFDLIRTTTGDPPTVKAGDLAVAGYASPASDEPFLMRTSGAGALIWNKSYNLGGAARFSALTEASPATGTPVGDLVAVGSYVKTGSADSQALAARASGRDGSVAAANQCFAFYGTSTTQDSFFSVVELKTAPLAGRLVMAGLTTSAATSDDIYLLRTQASPCLPLQQARYGGTDREIALDLRELLTPMAIPAIPAGTLAVTGDRANVAFTASDVPLLFVNAGNFGILSGVVFGSQLPGVEVGYSLERIPPGVGAGDGFVIAGFSTSDREAVGDPRDLYLIATNAFSTTGCNVDYVPLGQSLNWPNTVAAPTLRTHVWNGPLAPLSQPLSTSFPVCP